MFALGRGYIGSCHLQFNYSSVAHKLCESARDGQSFRGGVVYNWEWSQDNHQLEKKKDLYLKKKRNSKLIWVVDHHGKKLDHPKKTLEHPK